MIDPVQSTRLALIRQQEMIETAARYRNGTVVYVGQDALRRAGVWLKQLAILSALTGRRTVLAHANARDNHSAPQPSAANCEPC